MKSPAVSFRVERLGDGGEDLSRTPVGHASPAGQRAYIGAGGARGRPSLGEEDRALVGRRPRRPLVWAAIGTFGYPVPCLLLAVRAPVYLVAAGAAVAGIGSAINGTLLATVRQQRIPQQMLARISAITITGAFTLGSAGWAVIGPLAGVVGPTPLLAFAAGYGAVSSAVVLAQPAIRSVRWRSA